MTDRRREDPPVSGIEATLADGARRPPESLAPTLPPESIAATLAPDDSLAPTVAPPSGIEVTVAQTGPEFATHRERPAGASPAPSPSPRASTPTIRPPVRPSVKDNRYALGDEIARGGMGRVVAATDNMLGRVVAIKEALSPAEDLRLRFMRETKITARLEHPSIVPVYDAGTMPDGSPFYVMRKVSGQPLEKLVHDTPTVAQRLAMLPNLLAAANAVAHAHSRGIVHRDIKPSNILIGELGETIVIDWGLAKLVDDPDDAVVSSPLPPSDEDHAVQTRIGSVVGTPGFMPPEQLRGERVDARSDVYALGATLYFLLSRRAPHTARTGDEMMNAALAGPPTPLRDLVEGVPAELMTIVEKALAYGRRDRYHDAGGLAADLDRFLKGQLVASHRYSRRERLVRFWRRHRLALSVSAIALVTLLVGGALAITRIVEARKRADAALAEALVRNETLQLQRARDTVRTNPRGALAIVKPLAGKYWKEARAIALAAHATGVSRKVAVGAFALSMDLAEDGTRAISSSPDDGVLREHDLVGRTTREVAKIGGKFQVIYIDDERSAIAYGDGKTRLVDLASGAVRELFADDMLMPRGHGRQVWWIETKSGNFQLWTRNVDEAENKHVPVDDAVWVVTPGASAIALGGRKGLWIVRDGAGAAVAAGETTAIKWIDERTVVAVIDGRPTIVDIEAKTTRTLAYDGTARDVYLAPNGAFVVRGMSGRITVHMQQAVVELPPLTWDGELFSSAHHPYLVTRVDGDINVWDLHDVLPRETVLGQGYVHGETLHEQSVLHHQDGTATWVDMRTGWYRRVPLATRLSAAVIHPSGKHVIVCDATAPATYVTRAGENGTPLAITCKNGAWVGDVAVIGTPAGEVHVYDPAMKTAKLVYRGTKAPWSFSAAGDWVTCLFDDNAVWRYNVKTGATTTLPPSPTDRWVLIQDDGLVYTSDQATVRAWRVDGSFGPPFDIADRPGYLAWVDATHLFVFTRGDAGYVLDLTTGRATAAYPAGSRFNDLMIKGELGTFVNQDGTLWLMAPFTGDAWMIGRPAKAPFWRASLADDHSQVHVQAGGTLLTWRIPVARTRADTLALIESLVQ